MIGQYIDQLDEIGEMLDAPVIKGETTVKERQRLFNAFRSGEIGLLVVSKVANFSIDLPSAEVAIQVSGSFGSRQEEAQRLGRLLRPKSEGRSAHFYTIVSRDNRRRRLRAEPPALPRRAGITRTGSSTPGTCRPTPDPWDDSGARGRTHRPRAPPSLRSWSGERAAVDHEAVAHVGGEHALVGLVDLVGVDHLDLADDAVLGAEVEHLLGLGDAADHGAGERATVC